MTNWYLGLSTSGHDPALAIVDEQGQVVFAEATERFLQDKRAWGIVPDHVSHLAAAFASAGVSTGDRIHVSTSWSSTKNDRNVEVHDALLPGVDTLWMMGLQAQMQQAAGAALLRLGFAQGQPDIRRFDHHLCHAVTACYFSSFDDAACLVMDGEGDVGAVSSFRFSDRELTRNWRSWGPGSLGTLYGWLTGLCGFDWRKGEEWKVMGLAAFGSANPDLASAISRLLLVDRGRLRFADAETIAAVRDIAEQYRRAPDAPIMQAADLAASGQVAFAGIADAILEAIADSGSQNLILSGGCALNSSYNGTIAGRCGFDAVHVPPCPADDGNAIGAALLGWMADQGKRQIPYGGGSPYLGSRPSRAKLAACQQAAAQGLEVTDLGGNSANTLADRLAAGRILGVMRGRAEFGPRALGNRSILADPRHPDMKDKINRRVKGREPYRPFAPVVATQHLEDWFVAPQVTPYMAMALPFLSSVKERVPAVVHEDGTGRVQSVNKEIYPWMSDLLGALERETGVPVLLNTSFNIMGKPIVHEVEDAIGMLMTTGLDGVLIEDTLFEKKQ